MQIYSKKEFLTQTGSSSIFKNKMLLLNRATSYSFYKI